ncbi:MAG: hypothetical protein JRJ44_05405 [Deltaproteobacteria bacterium]|nr:hypothetical protein [Deltaproteobacteria bacterium]
MKFFSVTAVFVIIFTICCQPINAQDPQQEQLLRREVEKIQRERQESIRQTQPQRPLKEKETEKLEQLATDKDVLKGKEGCIKVNESILAGATILSDSLKKALTYPLSYGRRYRTACLQIL